MTDINKQVGINLYNLRKARGMHKAQVAKLFKVTVNTIANIETGRTSMNITRMKQFADLYEVEMYEILGYSNGEVVRLKIESLKDEIAKHKDDLIKLQKQLINKSRNDLYKGE